MTQNNSLDEYVFDHQVNEQREDFLTASLQAFNQTHTTAHPLAPHEALPLHLYALDQTGTMRAGLVGRTHAIPQWLEITLIWVDEPVRQQGLGRRLMEEAEGEARLRGCRYGRLATSNFQAPEFYERLGYSLYGRLENCPPGETVLYFWKELTVSQ